MEAFLETPGTTLLIALAVGVAIAAPTYVALRMAKLPRLARNAITAADFVIAFGLTVYVLPMIVGG